MKLTVRRVGNSLGVIIPKHVLDTWGLGEGDALELTDAAIRPPRALTHTDLDRLKRNFALAVVSRFSVAQIRAQILANLHRWKAKGTWVSAYDEWQRLAKRDDDGALLAAMLGDDEHSNQLRQSAPYVGLLASEEVQRINEQTAA
jgi:antitoxin component of MazEF toxin-antitoxin module